MTVAAYAAALTILLAAVLALIVWVGRARFHALVDGEVAGLFSDTGPALGPAPPDALPEPVLRHLRYAVPESAPAIRTVRLRHGGSFRTGPGQPWFPIEGEQYFTIGKPGFVWHGRLRLGPLLWIDARDRLLSGRGEMLVKMLSTFPLARAAGPEIDQGGRLRWLAETVWFPLAFLGECVRWEALDDCSARAVYLDEGLPASLVFEADEDGKFARVRGSRYRDLGGGRSVLTPWFGRVGAYREFDGFRVPSEIEAVWELETGEFPYARFRLTALEYNVARRYS